MTNEQIFQTATPFKRFQVGQRLRLEIVVKCGLSYYLEGNGFEVRCPALGAQPPIARGGAYREGAGFGIGLERLVLASEITRRR